MRRHIPNALTSLRIALAFAFPFAAESRRLAVLLAALATEYLDGALARRWGVETSLGRLLDPIADKLFFVSVGVTFVRDGRLALWQLLALSIRELAVALWAAILAARRDWAGFGRAEPGLAGKATTVLQYACLFDVLLEARLNPVLLVVTALGGAWSAVVYYTRAAR